LGRSKNAHAIIITSPDLLTEGVDLTQMIRNQDSPLNIWLPDLYMVNVKESNYLDETIRMQPGGVFFWSRHVVATIAQSQFGMYMYLEVYKYIIM